MDFRKICQKYLLLLFVGSLDSGKSGEEPGPGAYKIANENIRKQISPSWRIGTAKRLENSDVNSVFPGPGAYEPKLNVTT